MAVLYLISNIVYDEGVPGLPNEMVLELRELLDDDEIEHEASEFISNQTGFCHKGFDLSVISEL